MKQHYNTKIEDARKRHNNIQFERVQINAKLQWYLAQNKMRYFYPVKNKITLERLNQSKAELEVYQEIINSTYSCMQERVEENVRKHELVHELN